MDKKVQERLEKVRSKMKITRITCSRIVKGATGSILVSRESEYDSERGGMSEKEAKIASLLLGLAVDVDAHEQALAGGLIKEKYAKDAIRSINSNYSLLLSEVLMEEDDG